MSQLKFCLVYSQHFSRKHKFERNICFSDENNSCSKEIWESVLGIVCKCQIFCLFVSLVALFSKLQYNTASVEMVLDNKNNSCGRHGIHIMQFRIFYFGLALVSTWILNACQHLDLLVAHWECMFWFNFIGKESCSCAT